jgi:hypothetical protein
MAFLGGRFNAQEFDPSKNGSAPECLPADDYRAHIVKSAMKTTGGGNSGKPEGQMLELEFEVLDGEYAKRRFFDRLNIINANETAQRIANEALSAICHSVGVLDVEDSEDLHFKPLMVTLLVDPERDVPGQQGKKYPPSNRVKKYRPENGSDFGEQPTQQSGGRQQAQRTTAQPQRAATQPQQQAQPASGAQPSTSTPSGGSVPAWRRNRAA